MLLAGGTQPLVQVLGIEFSGTPSASDPVAPAAAGGAAYQRGGGVLGPAGSGAARADFDAAGLFVAGERGGDQRAVGDVHQLVQR